MSKQVLSVEQMHHLQELGLDTSKSSFCRFPLAIGLSDDGFPILSEKEYIISERKYESSFNYPAFTLQDILNLLPKEIITNDFHRDKVRLALDFFDNSFGYAYYFESCGELSFYKKECCYDEYVLIDAAYELLCWCIENGYVKINKK